MYYKAEATPMYRTVGTDEVSHVSQSFLLVVSSFLIPFEVSLLFVHYLSREKHSGSPFKVQYITPVLS
jgi:hypothetical protein